MYSTIQIGGKYSKNFTLFITKNYKVISPFHDISTYQGDDLINAVNEIPRFENAKFEVSLDVAMNPIKQDTKKGELRYIKNIFPHKGFMFNYGMIPQTYESKIKIDKHSGFVGDGDPLDVIEIGSVIKGCGEVYQAKVIGALCLIDDSECDWKIVVIDTNDPLFKQINSLSDINMHFNGLISMSINWFRDYKIPDGGKQNFYPEKGAWVDAEYAKKIIADCHNAWEDLLKDKDPGVAYDNTTIEKSDFYHQIYEIDNEIEQDKDLPIETKKFYYVN